MFHGVFDVVKRIDLVYTLELVITRPGSLKTQYFEMENEKENEIQLIFEEINFIQIINKVDRKHVSYSTHYYVTK